MSELKQSVSTTITLGPFISSADGVSPLTVLSIAQANVRLSKNGGAFAQKNDTTSATHRENGWYTVPINETDTSAAGFLTVAVHMTSALPVWREYEILTGNEWDANYSTILKNVNVNSIAGGVFVGTSAYNNFPSVSVSAYTNFPSVNVSGVTNGVITSADYAQDYFDKIESLQNEPITNVNVSSVDSVVINTIVSDIVTSGNAAGWGDMNTLSVSAIVNGVWEHTIDIVEAQEALKVIMAYASGNVTRVVDEYTYKDYNGTSDVMTISGTNSGRTVNKT